MFASNEQKFSILPIFLIISMFFLLLAVIIFPLLLTKPQEKPAVSGYHFIQSSEIISPISESSQNLRYIELPNQMSVLLVSDNESPKSACAVEVKAGSSDEPKEIMGLAHFLEHMLFQGSDKYPGNDFFDDFLSRNDGQTNAFTADHVTIFYFDVNNVAFDDSLDIFAHFFIDARLDPAAVEREIYAVNNEYQIDLQKNDWRFAELLKKLANKNSAYHRFSIGNIKTLKTLPESNNISVYEQLRKFYNSHYSADKMQLCLVSNQTLDQMEENLKKTFALVPIRKNDNENLEEIYKGSKKNPQIQGLFNILHQQLKRKKFKKANENENIARKPHETSWNFLNIRAKSRISSPLYEKISAFTPEDLGKYVWYKTLGDQQELTIVFVLNYTLNEDPFTRSWDYISELISNDYPAGFKAYLVNSGLINSVDAGFETGNFDFFMYVVKFDLTPTGFKMIPEIINNLFALLGKISQEGVKSSLYNEKSLISYLNFLYEQKQELDDEMLDLLQKMGVDLKYIYVSNQVYMKFDENVIQYWISQLQPANALFIIGSNDFQISQQIEKVEFKKQENFIQSEKSNGEWEIYDDFFEEINKNQEKTNNYRLKFNEKSEKRENISLVLLKNETKLVKALRKKLQKTKNIVENSQILIFKDYFTRQQHKHCEARRNHKKKPHFSKRTFKQTDNNGTISWLYDQKLDKEEEMMKVYYRVEPINSAQLTEISSNIMNYASILPAELILYQKNGFIPNDVSLIDDKCLMPSANNVISAGEIYHQRLLTIQNFTGPIDELILKNLKNETGKDVINSSCFQKELLKDRLFNDPEIIIQNRTAEIWLKKSREFNIPHSKVYLEFFYPNCGFESFMLDMFVEKLKENLDEALVEARVLGYNIDISKDSTGIKVIFQGFHSKLRELVKVFNEKISNLTFEEDEFMAIKMLYLLQDALGINQNIQPSEEVLQQAEMILKNAFERKDNSSSYASYLANSELKTLLDAIKKFKKTCRLKALFFGNILHDDAINILSNLSQNFELYDENNENVQKNDKNETEKSCIYDNIEKVLKVPNDVSLVYREKNLITDDINHAIINYYQWGIKDYASILKLRAFVSIFNVKAFDYLRTANQLGYIVFAQPLLYNEVIGIGVFVQGSKYNPYEMDGIIENFLQAFDEYFNDLNENVIQQELNNIHYEIFEKRNQKFSDKGDNYWDEISKGTYDFQKINYLENLKNINKDDVIQFYRDLVRNDQKKLSIQVWGGNMEITNQTLSKEQNYAGKQQKVIQNFDRLDSFVVMDQKLDFYSKKKK